MRNLRFVFKLAWFFSVPPRRMGKIIPLLTRKFLFLISQTPSFFRVTAKRGMGKNRSFHSLLKEKLNKPIENNNPFEAGSFHGYQQESFPLLRLVLSNHSKTKNNVLQAHRGSKVYSKFKSKLSPFLLTQEEEMAINHLEKMGIKINNPFNYRTLKLAWRKVALLYHPDRGGQALEFIRAQRDIETLKQGLLTRYPNPNT